MSKNKHDFKIKSLKGQLIGRIFIVLFFTLMMVEIIQYFVIRNYLITSKEELLLSRLHNVDIELLLHTNTPELMATNASEFVRYMLDLNVAVSVLDQTGSIIAVVDDSQLKDYQDHLLKNDKEFIIQNDQVPYLTQAHYLESLKDEPLHHFEIVKNSQGADYLVLISKVGLPDQPVGLIQLSTSMASIYTTLWKQMQISVGVAVMLLALGLLSISQVIKWTLNPLNKMKKTIDGLTVHALDQRINEDNGQIEIDQLAKAYNEMVTRIDTSFTHEMEIKEKMRQFISDASHELRTPLTSIHGFAEVLLMGAAKDEKQLHLALQTILLESDRLTQLVKDLLTLSKLDQKSAIERNNVYLAEIIKEIQPQIEFMAKERHVVIPTIDENLIFYCNKNQIKQVLLNIVHNSIQFTDPTTGNIQIEIHEQKSSKSLLFKITDNGRGMSLDTQSKIFDRFYRGQEDRARESGGYGLGLSIVQGIVTAHQGAISFASELNKGTVCSIVFPIETVPFEK